MSENNMSRQNKTAWQDDAAAVTIIKGMINFLGLFVPETLAKRIVCIVLIMSGIPANRVIHLSGLSERTVRTLRKELRDRNDVSGLLCIQAGSGRTGKAAGIEQQIMDELEKGNYHTRQQIADMISEKFHIKMSVSAVGNLLKKNGFRRLKCGSIPAKADTAAQMGFYDTVLHPLMKKASEGEISLLFLDASHVVMGCDFLGYIYGKVRRLVKTFSGRRRYNVLGALDFVTKKVLVVANDSYITASEVCMMLQKVAAEYVGKEIYLVLDNARYQKCSIVQELAAGLGIHLEYIPPYSPNLNLIERLWKFVKGELRSKYYDDFALFKEKIDSIIKSTTNENKSKVDSLVGEKVQLYDNLHQVTENTFEQIRENKTA